MSKLSDFLYEELERRGWSKRELARRAGVSNTQVTDVMNERTNPGADFCIAIARALGESPEAIMRLAEILPPLPSAVAKEREVISLFHRLDEHKQQSAIAMMSGLAGQPAPPAPESEPDPEPDGEGPLASWTQGDETVELLSAATVSDEARAAWRDVGERPADIPPVRWALATLLSRLLDGLPPEDVDAVFAEMKRIRARLGGNTGAEPSAEENG